MFVSVTRIEDSRAEHAEHALSTSQTYTHTITITYTCALVYTTEESTQWLSMRVFLRFSFSCILAFLGGPREARGRLTAPGALRRRPPYGGGRASRGGARFARPS